MSIRCGFGRLGGSAYAPAAGGAVEGGAWSLSAEFSIAAGGWIWVVLTDVGHR